MLDLLQALINPDFPFFRYALIAGLLSSPAFGIIGTYVVVNRITYIAGAVSHAALAGIGAGLFFGFSPLAGATIASVLAGGIISLVQLHAGEREDSIIGTIWAAGMAIGLLFISQSSGYQDPMSYLFGNILLIGRQDLYLLLALDTVIAITGIALYPYLQAISFDAEFARTRGIDASLFQFVMTLLISLTVVLMVTIVGIVMVIALLTIPAASAGTVSGNLKQMMVRASLLTAIFHISGLAVSYATDLPTGAVTIITAAVVYFAMLGIKQLRTAMHKKSHTKNTGGILTDTDHHC